MIKRWTEYVAVFGLLFMLAMSSCNKKTATPAFTLLDAGRTGLNFSNKLTPTDSFNMFHYMYYYNGAGIGAGDFNNDGLIDLFFASNQNQNQLYLNKGMLKFTDATKEAQIPDDQGWSTGVSVVDINNDGLMDIYVCRVGNYETLKSKNQFLICQGIDKNNVPYYKDEASKCGVDFSGFSTQALFFDYDMDGDLDMFLLNHSVHQNGSFAPRGSFIGTYNELSGDRIYRNDGNHFTNVTKETGINSSAISYGLGVAASDINLDGYPDLYAGNDFHENDYLYINQHNGTFKEEVDEHIMHTSLFSMGVDIADVNNDGYPEIISMDMLPDDPYILKRSLGEDEYNTFNLKLNYGYNYQYTRNNLQLNRRNGMFSEVGLYAGVYATDWSWAPLFMDFDNDGLKDLFVANGIPKRLNDIDYINYVSNNEVQEKIRTNSLNDKDMTLIDKFPQIKLPNKFFKNGNDLTFHDIANTIENDQPTYSNGAIYADLDNDGDLDVVVNNIDDPAMVYENHSNDKKDNNWTELKLKGDSLNINAVGAKIVLFANDSIRTYEKYPARGFQSSMEDPMHIGLNNTKIDSMFLVWPDNTYQMLDTKQRGQVSISYKKNLPVFDYKIVTSHHKDVAPKAEDITNSVMLWHLHNENNFNEFDREPLIPHMVSQEGPALAIGDINNDGLSDVFIGSSKTFKSAVYLQTKTGSFRQLAEPALEVDSMFEFVDACWVDVNNDKYLDLVVASGGNEYYGEEEQRSPVVYVNDGKGKLSKLPGAFNGVYLNASCVASCDFNNDGNIDLFVGGRAVPWNYGETPRSYLLQNDGKGNFKDVTSNYAKELLLPGFVTSASWCDMDKDGDQDLVLSLEWGSITVFINDKGKFTKKTLSNEMGWWNFVLPCDVDNDGDIDFIAGNLGLNSRLKASESEPLQMYFTDFDDNGKKDQLLTYYLHGRQIPFATKDELQRQMPFLKKKYLYAEEFAKASLNEMFTKEKLANATKLTANYLSSAVFINNGNLQFSVKALPPLAQLSPLFSAAPTDLNNDGLTDFIVGGNFYPNNISMGRYDADFGSVLMNKGHGNFSCESLNGVVVKGQVRKIKKLTINNREAFVLARNNDSTKVIRFDVKK